MADPDPVPDPDPDPDAAPDADAAPPPALDHVAIAVPGLADALRVWRDGLGLPATGGDVVAEQGVRVAFLDLGNGGRIELLEPLDPGDERSAVARHLVRRGPGVHHIALRVPDVAAAMARLKAQGYALTADSPEAGAHGTRVAFVHPRSTGGVLVELVEHPEEGPA